MTTFEKLADKIRTRKQNNYKVTKFLGEVYGELGFIPEGTMEYQPAPTSGFAHQLGVSNYLISKVFDIVYPSLKNSIREDLDSDIKRHNDWYAERFKNQLEGKSLLPHFGPSDPNLFMRMKKDIILDLIKLSKQYINGDSSNIKLNPKMVSLVENISIIQQQRKTAFLIDIGNLTTKDTHFIYEVYDHETKTRHVTLFKVPNALIYTYLTTKVNSFIENDKFFKSITLKLEGQLVTEFYLNSISNIFADTGALFLLNKRLEEEFITSDEYITSGGNENYQIKKPIIKKEFTEAFNKLQHPDLTESIPQHQPYHAPLVNASFIAFKDVINPFPMEEAMQELHDEDLEFIDIMKDEHYDFSKKYRNLFKSKLQKFFVKIFSNLNKGLYELYQSGLEGGKTKQYFIAIAIYPPKKVSYSLADHEVKPTVITMTVNRASAFDQMDMLSDLSDLFINSNFPNNTVKHLLGERVD